MKVLTVALACLLTAAAANPIAAFEAPATKQLGKRVDCFNSESSPPGPDSCCFTGECNIFIGGNSVAGQSFAYSYFATQLKGKNIWRGKAADDSI
ncbi:hypothetical protein LTR10_003514 [Elasticomyces elasticus]|nr:hypothetical protein LTR10_003514 [Elasticomyces elasticus]KAK4969782.1 hypothetical protein LTR42_009054 [Elasticomyces elasticus]